MKRTTFSFLLGAVYFLTGCATNLPFHGSPLNLSNDPTASLRNLAVLSPIGPALPDFTVYALYVNGTKVRNLRWNNGDSAHGPPYVLLSPGKHLVEFHVIGLTENAVVEMEVELQPGHTYIPYGERNKSGDARNEVIVWLEDKGNEFSLSCLPTKSMETTGWAHHYEVYGCPPE